MLRTIKPATAVRGVMSLPGDKSISHRYGMLTAIAEGDSEIENYSTGADCASTLECMRAMGVEIEREGNLVRVRGRGLDGLRAPERTLDAGNSGSTIRMLSGILAGQPFLSRIEGDESLARRPMRRIIAPLEKMGARIEARDGDFPPLTIHGARLRPIHYDLPVASAQIKTAVLFGGIFAEGRTSVREPLTTRNHSEILLRQLGASVESRDGLISIEGRPQLRGRKVRVPSDLSSATFFIAAALLLPGSELRIEGVGLNPTRTDLLDVLKRMGADLEAHLDPDDSGEPIGTIIVRGPKQAGRSVLSGGVIEGATTAGVIDEAPMLAVLGALSEQGLEIRDAAELRVKETDRVATVVDNLARMGVAAEARPDGMKIPGRQRLKGAQLDSFGDHRIAMAFAIAALAAEGPSTMANAEAASVSFPEFYDKLAEIVESD